LKDPAGHAIILIMLLRPGVVLLLVAWTCLIPVSRGVDPQRFDVHLRLVMEGEYRLLQGEARTYGVYRCVLTARAMLERDNGDFILYALAPAPQERAEVTWTETTDSPQEHHVSHLDKEVQLELAMRFALREQGRVKLDLEVSGNVDTPGLAERGLKLWLPRSHTGGEGNQEKRYLLGVRRGSSRVEWRESAMCRPGGTQGKCAWIWRENRDHWSHSHDVQVEFAAAPVAETSR